jgi:type I restriction enzyme S subunit
MTKLIKLSQAIKYSDDRIKAHKLDCSTYVGIDNLLPNKEGLRAAENLPAGIASVPAYREKNILVGNIRPYLKKIWYSDKSGGCSADVLNFEVNDGFDPKFVYYTMLRDDFFSHMMRGAKGTKMPRGDKAHILEFLIPDFDLNQQKKISEVLSSIDKKITINKKIALELDALGLEVYKFWFEQYNFPNEFGKPFKKSGGLMKWDNSLKKEIPFEWSVSSLSNLIKSDKGGDWGEETPNGNYQLEVNCIRGADINGLNGLEVCDPPVRYILPRNKEKILSPRDLVVEISGGSPTQSTGRMAFLTDQTFGRFDKQLICSNFCKAISLKDELLLFPFAYRWYELYNHGTFFSFEGKTSGIKNLLFEAAVESCYMAVPSIDILIKFESLIGGLEAEKQMCLLESQRLILLRDWLLPLLMNNQIHVN